MLFRTATLRYWNNVIKLNLVIFQNSTTYLTLTVVSTNNAQHNVPRNIPTDPTQFPCFRKRLISKKDRAEMTKNSTGFL